MEIFKMLDVRTFMTKVPYVCKDWQAILTGEKTRKQAGKLFKAHCFHLWVPQLYRANAAFLTKFGNWRQMLKNRPLLRFDGFYICKMMYRRQGLNVNSLNYPVHDVTWYRYIRFKDDGSAVSLYTNAAPKRFLPKYTQSLQTGAPLQEEV
jgi:F-box protein 9